MKSSVYLFTYTHDGLIFEDYVVAENIARANYIFGHRYPHVLHPNVKWIAPCLT